MKQRSNIFIILLVLSTTFINAQHPSVKGNLKDIHNQPLAFVDVLLFHMPDSSQVATALSDEGGNYLFTEVPAGKYALMAYMSDLNESISKHIVIDSSVAIYEHDMTLPISITKADAVVMTSQKAMVRQDADKMVVNVESSLASSGLSGIDVLRRVPGVTVDKDGKINIKGKNGVQVMLDDKPLYLSEEQLASLLKAIPSDMIKEIELITSPSAKYDAVGNGGIVNIRLKEGAYEGFNGNNNASLGYGRYYKSNAGVNASYKKKKYALDFGYQLNHNRAFDDFTADRISQNENLNSNGIYSSAYYKNLRTNHTLFFKGKHTLYKSGTLGYHGNMVYGIDNWSGINHTHMQNKEGIVSERYDTHDKGDNKSGSTNWGIDFAHTFDTLGTRLSSEFNSITSFNSQDRHMQTFAFDGSTASPVFSTLGSLNSDHTSVWNAKIDFTKKLKGIKMETGIKTNQFHKKEPQALKLSDQASTRDSSSDFKFDEKISAAYLMFSGKVEKWKLQGGLRLEHTENAGYVSAYDTTFKRNYTNLFPSFSTSYQVSEKTSYTLQYSKRIQRPEAEQLSPLVNILDRYTRWGGSPYLLPEYTHNVELTHSAYGGFLITSINYSYTQNPINWIMNVDPNTLKTEMGNRNLKSRSNVGVSVAVNMPITSWWQSSNYVYVYRNEIVGDMGAGLLKSQSNSFKANCTQTIKLPKSFNFELSANYEAEAAYSYGRSMPFGQINLALQKSILKGKASLKLAYSDIFWTHKYRNVATYNGVYSVNTYKWDNRVLICTFSYKFGKRLDM